MDKSDLYANCIAIALDFVKIYYVLCGLGEPKLNFQEVDMVKDTNSQKRIFKVLCDQIVTLHTRVYAHSDMNELIYRLLKNALEIPSLDELLRISKALDTHCFGNFFMINFLVPNNRFNDDVGFLLEVLDPALLVNVKPKKLSAALPPDNKWQLSVLSEPSLSHVVPSNNNVTVFDVGRQTYSSLYVMPAEKIKALSEKYNTLEDIDENGEPVYSPVSSTEKASFMLLLDSLKRQMDWKNEFLLK
jgi:hypothetical protein